MRLESIVVQISESTNKRPWPTDAETAATVESQEVRVGPPRPLF